MRIINGIDGKEYEFKYNARHNSRNENKSNEHLLGRALLKKIFPLDPVVEEVFLPGSYGLYADFYLPRRNMVVETHGRQHYEFVSFFHTTMIGFQQQVQRDKNKKIWCEKNNISYVELPYKETEDEWRKRIISHMGQESDTETE